MTAMHAAPPVRFACNAGTRWPRVQRLLFSIAAAVTAAWVAAWLEGSPAWQMAAALAAAAAVGWISARWIARGPATLVWDGLSWSLHECRGGVEPMVDLGPWMLLRFCPEARPGATAARWLALDAASAGDAFHLCRAAIYASRPNVEAGPA